MNTLKCIEHKIWIINYDGQPVIPIENLKPFILLGSNHTPDMYDTFVIPDTPWMIDRRWYQDKDQYTLALVINNINEETKWVETPINGRQFEGTLQECLEQYKLICKKPKETEILL